MFFNNPAKIQYKTCVALRPENLQGLRSTPSTSASNLWGGGLKGIKRLRGNKRFQGRNEGCDMLVIHHGKI